MTHKKKDIEMKTPFKVGERVAMYSSGQKYIGKIEEIGSHGLNIRTGDILWNVHPKQCRRLVKRKHREIWVNEYSDDTWSTGERTKEECEQNAYKEDRTWLGTFRYTRAKEQK